MVLTFYRKYRPKTLADLVGQEEISEVIRNAAKTDRIGHAYLFYGPRGTGKTTTARILAKIANCETRMKDKKFHDTGEPCNKCRPCLEIDASQALDVVEIDAASNRGIDEMRNLKEGIKLAPSSYRYKVYIIDEAHQLTKEASNALLKTLEEPPEHVIFVLATTEYDKLPTTVVSRTQRFNFHKAPLKLIAGELRKIADAEKIKAEESALELIAASAEGSFRDAESLLEQVSSFEKEVTLSGVESVLGKVGLNKTGFLSRQLLEGNLEGSIKFIEEMDESGSNMVQLTKDLLQYLRRVLSLHFDPNISSIFEQELTDDELKEMKEQAKLVKLEKDVPLIKSLIQAYSEMRYSPFPIVPIEVAIIENLGGKK
ncbi:MAG: DNA polymerase III subunit gamma/tau [Patescibacteria group bacterium]|nr:DNA polymerase III subunit gamma/tau [Patescibacteria group bacterium]